MRHLRKAPHALANDEFYLSSMQREVDAMMTLITRKRADYGGSIGYHGVKGIMPRVADKFFRLDHGIWDDAQMNHESLIDTCVDLAVYVLSMAVQMRYEASFTPMITGSMGAMYEEPVGGADKAGATASVPAAAKPRRILGRGTKRS